MRYDIRGKYPNEVNEELASIIGEAFPSSKKIIIGGDLRTSTPFLKNAIIYSLNAESIEDLGIANSDLVAFYAKHENSKGIMITASHNPWEFNGFKFLNENSTPFNNEQLEEIKKNSLEISKVEKKEKKYVPRYQEGYEAYFYEIKDKIGTKFDINIYAINSAALAPLKYANKQNIIKTKVIGDSYVLDPSIPSNPSLEYVKNLDMKKGVVLDADADRGIIIDDKKPVNAHALIYAFAKALNSKKIVVSVDFSEDLKKRLEEKGIKVETTPVGDVFVSNKCYNMKCNLFAEPNYHFGFPFISYYSSGVLAGLIYDAYDVRKYLPNQLPYFYSESINLKKETFAKLKETIKKKYEVINEIDGIKFKVNTSYVLLRFSGTSHNKARIYIEDTEKERIKKALAHIKHLINEVVV